MKKRNATLAELFGVIAALFAVAAIHFWFWSFYTSGMRSDIKRKGREVGVLKNEIAKLKKSKSQADKKASQYIKQINEREKELRQYGDFLPSIRTKPLVIKEILSLVEELGISILKIENEPIQKTEGSYTFNFSLKLEGSYKAFKLFMSKIYKSERIFRVKKFEVGTYDNAAHNMDVVIEFQTYFAAN